MPTLQAQITFKGSRSEGLVSAGETFKTSERRARLHVEAGRAERVEKSQRPEYIDKMQRFAYENKAGKRSWEGSGSWKTLYEDGTQVDKVQASGEEADAWADGDKTIDEIQ